MQMGMIGLGFSTIRVTGDKAVAANVAAAMAEPGAGFRPSPSAGGPPGNQRTTKYLFGDSL